MKEKKSLTVLLQSFTSRTLSGKFELISQRFSPLSSSRGFLQRNLGLNHARLVWPHFLHWGGTFFSCDPRNGGSWPLLRGERIQECIGRHSGINCAQKGRKCRAQPRDLSIHIKGIFFQGKLSYPPIYEMRLCNSTPWFRWSFPDSSECYLPQGWHYHPNWC